MMNLLRAKMAAATLLLSGTMATAQTAWVEIEDGDMVVDIVVVPRTYTVDDIEEMSVVGTDGEEIGEIEEVLASADGSQIAIATEVGGFLGVGEKDVLVPLGDARIVGDRIVLDMTKEQIEALDDWAEE